MPEADAQVTTDFEGEYKKLQKKYNRRNKSAKEAESRIVILESGVSRIESALEGLTNLIVGDDVQLKSSAEHYIGDMSARRNSDNTVGELQARLNQTLDEADEDWDDVKFDNARRALHDINESGDYTRGPEVERLIQSAISGQEDDRSVQEQIDAAVAAAEQSWQKEVGRVDTGDSSSKGGPVSRRDLTWKEGESINDFRARVKSAHDQIST